MVRNLLDTQKSKKSVTVKQIQKVAGSLNVLDLFQTLPTGRPFLASLYCLTRGKDGSRALGVHHPHLNQETVLNLKMF